MNKPLYYRIFNIANYYNQGSIILSRELQNTGNAGLSAPMILNQSFSMELLLKFFLIVDYDDIFSKADLEKKGINIKGHLYSQLFDKIDNTYKISIAHFYNSNAATQIDYNDFKNLLIELGDNTFVEWRYIFEKESPQNLNSMLFNRLLDSLGKAAEDILKRKKTNGVI
ncbi:MAG TPA: hypothetical protein C5S37_13050 [Methanophagales archaeon]|nr:hypothetical protein [Methanophagales archaeon]